MNAIEYFKSHAINPDFAKQYGWFWDDKEIHIPIFDGEGKFMFNKHRNLLYDPNDPQSTKYRYDSGSHAALFNYHRINDKSYIVVAEGEADSLVLNQEGVPSASSTGGSQTFKLEWATLLENKIIFICYDNDKAGREGTEKLFALFPEAKAVLLPEGIKDVCEFFAAGHTRQEFIDLLKNSFTEEKWNEHFRPEDYKQITADELVNMVFPPENWLVDRIIYKEGFCFLYGAEGTGKSFLTLSIAQAVATGTPWLDTFKVPEASKVLFIDKENPKSMLSKRLKGMGITGTNLKWIKYPEKLQLTDERGNFTDFAQAIADDVKAEGIKLIIIDSFVDLMVGNENVAGDTQKFFDAMRILFPGIAILVLHHENKPSQGVFRNDSQRARGSSNINAQTVTQFRLEAVAKSKTDLTIKQTKARDAQKLDKFMVQMVVEADGEDQTKVTGFKYLGTVLNEEEANKTDEAKSLIIEILTDEQGVSRQRLVELAQANAISEKTVQRVLKEMTEQGILDETKDGRNKFYSLTNKLELPPE